MVHRSDGVRITEVDPMALRDAYQGGQTPQEFASVESLPVRPAQVVEDERVEQVMSPIVGGGGRRSSRLWIWVGGSVVIGTIILIGIAIVVLARALPSARGTLVSRSCIRNMKDIANAMSMYGARYDDRLPLATSWMDGIQPLVARPRTLKCPAFRRTNPDAYGYAIADAVAGKTIASIPLGNRAPIVFETDDLKRNAHGAPFKPAPPKKRHGWAVYDVFIDGKVRTRQGQ